MQTGTELIAHAGLKSPMRPRTHTPDRKLLCQLIQRRLDASAQPHLEFPKVIAASDYFACRQQTGVLSFEQLPLEGLRNITFVAKHWILAPFRQHAQHLSVIYSGQGNRKINRHALTRRDQMPPKPKERSETFRAQCP